MISLREPRNEYEKKTEELQPGKEEKEALEEAVAAAAAAAAAKKEGKERRKDKKRARKRRGGGGGKLSRCLLLSSPSLSLAPFLPFLPPFLPLSMSATSLPIS